MINMLKKWFKKPLKNSEDKEPQCIIDKTSNENKYSKKLTLLKEYDRQILDFFIENTNLLFEIAIPMIDVAINKKIVEEKYLKEFFRNEIDNLKINNFDLKNELNEINKREFKFFNSCSREINSTGRYISDNFRNLNMTFYLFSLSSNSEEIDKLTHSIWKISNNYDRIIKEAVNRFIKFSYEEAIHKIFVFYNMMTYIKENDKLYKIMTNSLYKYGSVEVAANNTYNLFKEYTKTTTEDVSFDVYTQIMLFTYIFNHNYDNFYDLEFDKSDIDELTNDVIQKRDYIAYDYKKFAKTMIFHCVKKCSNIFEATHLFSQEKIICEKFKQADIKDDLLNNDYIGKSHISINDIDLMTGIEFEQFIIKLFTKLGYKCSNTIATGDQGVDVIAEKDKLRIAIQAKCYSNVVGNHAIMEAVAGMKYYKANKCMVITNNVFTKKAKELALSNDVQLWDRKMLIEKIRELAI